MENIMRQTIELGLRVAEGAERAARAAVHRIGRIDWRHLSSIGPRVARASRSDPPEAVGLMAASAGVVALTLVALVAVA